MHSLAVQLAPVIAAEKSKVPFYVCGGLLVLWALVVSLGLGLRNPRFPGNAQGQRTVIAITVVLVLAAASTAVITSGGEKSGPSPHTYTTGESVPPTPGAVPTPAASTSSESSGAASAASTTSTQSTTSSAAASPAAGATKTPAKGASTVALEAVPNQIAYNTKSLSAKAGKVTITMANMSSLEHNVTIAEGSKVLGATPTFSGGSRTLTLQLKPGRYTFYCSVPGHRQAGMEGTLTVS
jgi:plastocyanin